MGQVSGCQKCATMAPVIDAAEDLIDAAAEGNNEEEIVTAAAALKIAVSEYRNKVRNPEEETDAVQ